MATRIISVLCEGPHDVAFLSKLIRTIGFKVKDTTRLSDYPEPLNDIFLQEVKKSNFEELAFNELRNYLLPMTTLSNGDNWFMFYALGGDSRSDLRDKILLNHFDQNTMEGEIQLLPEDTDLSLVYFFDADKEGVDSRIQKINSELTKVVEEVKFENNGQIISIGKISLGCYIFSELEKTTGKLEDVVLPVMKLHNEVIFEAAEEYLKAHYSQERDKKKGFEFSKATIGIVGQLQKSGMTNQVIIGQTDYITKEKLKNDQKCKEILDFFNKLLLT